MLPAHLKKDIAGESVLVPAREIRNLVVNLSDLIIWQVPLHVLHHFAESHLSQREDFGVSSSGS